MVLRSAFTSPDRFARRPHVTFYSACDVSECARSALMSHPTSTRPHHVFGEILERVPEPHLTELRRLEKHYLELWAMTKAEFSLGGIAKSDLRTQCDILGAEYVGKCLDVLSSLELNAESYCYIHNRACPLAPPGA